MRSLDFALQALRRADPSRSSQRPGEEIDSFFDEMEDKMDDKPKPNTNRASPIPAEEQITRVRSQYVFEGSARLYDATDELPDVEREEIDSFDELDAKHHLYHLLDPDK